VPAPAGLPALAVRVLLANMDDEAEGCCCERLDQSMAPPPLGAGAGLALVLTDDDEEEAVMVALPVVSCGETARSMKVGFAGRLLLLLSSTMPCSCDWPNDCRPKDRRSRCPLLLKGSPFGPAPLPAMLPPRPCMLELELLILLPCPLAPAPPGEPLTPPGPLFTMERLRGRLATDATTAGASSSA